MLIGERKRTVKAKYGLTSDNRPCYAGQTITMGGPPPLSEQIKKDHDRLCATCGESNHHGVFTIGLSEFGVLVRLWRHVDFVTFECVDCLHERDPVTYPETDMG